MCQRLHASFDSIDWEHGKMFTHASNCSGYHVLHESKRKEFEARKMVLNVEMLLII